MMQELAIFKSKKLHFQMLCGEPYFCVKDICDGAELKNPESVLRRLRNTEMLSNHPGIVTMINTETPTGIRSMAYVDEMGLYEIVGNSRKPKARELHRQVIMALPGLRKQGNETERLMGIIESMSERIKKLETRRLTSVEIPKLLPPVKDTSTRSKISQIVRQYVFAFSPTYNYRQVWSMLYREFRDRNHIDLRQRAKNADANHILDMAEKLECMDDLFALAVKLFVGSLGG